jgi:hypothetical protein
MASKPAKVCRLKELHKSLASQALALALSSVQIASIYSWHLIDVMPSPCDSLHCECVVVVVVLRVCLDSWRSYRGFSRQELLSRSGLPLPSPQFIVYV